ncbi:hypothetical protein TrVE_jg5309 [Triparma verrucosa]|uniref:tRNA dimethylallyltransferase n=1 Tax=Triparma verrucosa TaxID=1606542 RepID=A0A9W7B7B2_9STRA|nr:hypothetical protein TrVE_jg5309 [Triparma verrucosa]
MHSAVRLISISTLIMMIIMMMCRPALAFRAVGNAGRRRFSGSNVNKVHLEAQRVTLITGPTSVGKTQVSVSLARKPSLIVSADSVQVYEELTIGANKPTEEELRGWGIPHELIGVMPLHPADDLESSTAASWYNETVRLLADNSDVVVCGGSSMYVDWLLNGMPNAPGWSNKGDKGGGEDWQVAIDEGVEEAGWDRNNQSDVEWVEFTDRVLDILTREGGVLGTLDQGLRTELRAKLNAVTKNDLYRLKRAVQVAVSRAKGEGERGGGEEGGGSGGVLFANRRKERDEKFDFRPFFLCPASRREHFHLIDERCEKMILRGLVDEVGRLVVDYDLANAPVSRAIGYRQTIDYLRREGFQRGDIKAFKEYLGKFKAATRQYAKQQMQWWRRNEDIMFVPVDVRRGMSKAEVDESLGAAAKIIDRLREVEAEEWKSELADDNGVNKVTRAINLEQGGQMRTFQSRSYFIVRVQGWKMPTNINLPTPRMATGSSQINKHAAVVALTASIILGSCSGAAMAAVPPSRFENSYDDQLHPLCERNIKVVKIGKNDFRAKFSGTDTGPPGIGQKIQIDCSAENIEKYKLREWEFDGVINGDKIDAGDGVHEGFWSSGEGWSGIRWADGNRWIVKDGKSVAD